LHSLIVYIITIFSHVTLASEAADSYAFCVSFSLVYFGYFLIVLIVVSDIEICPSSIASYFSSGGFTCTVGVHRMKRPKLRHMLVPKIDKDASEAESCCTREFYEWLGFVACGW